MDTLSLILDALYAKKSKASDVVSTGALKEGASDAESAVISDGEQFAADAVFFAPKAKAVVKTSGDAEAGEGTVAPLNEETDPLEQNTTNPTAWESYFTQAQLQGLDYVSAATAADRQVALDQNQALRSVPTLAMQALQGPTPLGMLNAAAQLGTGRSVTSWITDSILGLLGFDMRNDREIFNDSRNNARDLLGQEIDLGGLGMNSREGLNDTRGKAGLIDAQEQFDVFNAADPQILEEATKATGTRAQTLEELMALVNEYGTTGWNPDSPNPLSLTDPDAPQFESKGTIDWGDEEDSESSGSESYSEDI